MPVQKFTATFETNEMVLANALSALGPCVAIGRPGETVSEPGAARIYVSQSSWQERVSELVSSARLVVICVRSSAGLLWEIEHVCERLEPHKIVFYIPWRSNGEAEGARRHSLLELLRVSAKQCVELPADIGDATLIMFDRKGRAKLIGKRQNPTSYMFRADAETLAWRLSLDEVLSGRP
jgi:hypothetical protein